MPTPFVTIEDPADPRVEPFLNVRDRDLVGRHGLFMAEGEVVLRHLVASRRCEPVAFLVAAPRAASVSSSAGSLRDTSTSMSQSACDQPAGHGWPSAAKCVAASLARPS